MLNIKKIKRKENKKEEKLQENTNNIIINKPDAEDQSERNDYEQKIEVKCLVCNISLEYQKDEEILNLVTSILQALSESEKENKNEIDAIQPCEHTLTLQQKEDLEKNLIINKCNNCYLQLNLWLCLICGNVFCGNKDTGGNGHIIEHYTKSAHPLVAKISTISDDSEAFLYCYSCNKEVRDESLSTHLQILGINVDQPKNEKKAENEKDLLFNQTRAIEESKVLTPLSGPGYIGLENLGNSCHMNSIIQILLNLEPFKNRYFNNALEHLNICTKDSSNCYLCQMSKLAYGLHSGTYSHRKIAFLSKDNKIELKESQDGINPISFKLYFEQGYKDFSSNKQQDALEYLSYLLTKMKNEEKKYKKFDPKSLFEFDLEERMECNICHIVKYQSSRTWFLSLSIDDWKNKKEKEAKYSITETLQKFLSPENIEKNCPECKKKVSWTKTQRILNYPEYLIIVFRRFVFDKKSIKIEASFEPTLNNLDIKILSESHKKENEKLLDLVKEKAFEEKIENKNNKQEDEEYEEQDIKFNQADINYLLDFGIPELGAKWSLYVCNQDRESAIGFYCENGENPQYKKPLPKVKVKKNKNNNKSEDLIGINIESLNYLTEMGFGRSQAINALKMTNGDINEAINFICNNPKAQVDINQGKMEMDIEEKKKENKMEIEEDKQIINEGNGSIYDLYGFITHLGKNTDHGHYVCHIRQEGNKWTYFNDSKVTLWEEPPIKKGYIYFYRNLSNDSK